MKITKHISFFYDINRICYLNKIIDETNKYEYITDIFIHTNNKDLNIETFNKYNNGILTIIYHDLTTIHPYQLTWQCRILLTEQKDDYDIFIYIEDDILIPWKGIEYWCKYNEILIKNNYNLGFVRIETKNNKEYITDVLVKLNKIVYIDNQEYVINDNNPYCAMWIYNKNEFNNFLNSKYYDLNNINEYGLREKSAIGLHGINYNWYKNTIIPIINDKLDENCRIYHLPNNYANIHNSIFAKMPFEDVFARLSL